MKTVFIGGSRKLSRLNQQVRHRLDNIVEKGFSILIGDANGADRAVQTYLASKRYRKVTVFFIAGNCRNNVGDWVTHVVRPAHGAKGFAYFSAKDRVMAEEADYGLMLWDGKSRGTLTSIVDLIRHERPVVVYVASEKSFTTLHGRVEFADFVRRLDPAVLNCVEPDLLEATGVHRHRKLDASLF